MRSPSWSERGFLAYTRRCGPNKYHRASWYRFVDVPCRGDEALDIVGRGPTDDFLRWTEPAKPPRFASSVARTKKAPKPYRHPDDGREKPYRVTDDAEIAESLASACVESQTPTNSKKPAVVRNTDIPVVTTMGAPGNGAVGGGVGVDSRGRDPARPTKRKRKTDEEKAASAARKLAEVNAKDKRKAERAAARRKATTGSLH